MLSLNGNLIQGVGDNFDCTINSQNGLKQTHSIEESPNLVVVDGCAFLWSTLWPTKGCVNGFINSYIERLLRLLKDSDVYLVFDRYFQFSIKCATRSDCGKSSLRAFNVNLSIPLPLQADILNHIGNKKQLIEIIVCQLTEILQTRNFMYCLLITAKDAVPIELKDGELAYKEEWSVHHEEADVIITQQAMKAILERKVDNVRFISDDTDVFILLVHFHWKYKLSMKLTMEATRGERTIIDVGKTVAKHGNILHSLLAAHGISGCDTVSHYRRLENSFEKIGIGNKP